MRKDFKIPMCSMKMVKKGVPCIMSYLLSKILNKGNKLYMYGLKNSKFNLMIKGDTPTSGKFYDSLAVNMINIFVGVREETINRYLPFANVIPYQKFCFFISPQQFYQQGVTILHNIISNTSDDQIKNMLSNLTQYKKDLLWNINGSRVVSNMFDEVQTKWEYIMQSL